MVFFVFLSVFVSFSEHFKNYRFFKKRLTTLMIVELKVQYRREKLQDLFDINETFLQCTIYK